MEIKFFHYESFWSRSKDSLHSHLLYNLNAWKIISIQKAGNVKYFFLLFTRPPLAIRHQKKKQFTGFSTHFTQSKNKVENGESGSPCKLHFIVLICKCCFWVSECVYFVHSWPCFLHLNDPKRGLWKLGIYGNPLERRFLFWNKL